MALHFSLQVNGEDIGYFTAVRRERVIPNDRICTYDVAVETVTKPSREHRRRTGSQHTLDTRRTVRIRHNYDAGPWELVRAALDAVQEVQHATDSGAEAPASPQQT